MDKTNIKTNDTNQNKSTSTKKTKSKEKTHKPTNNIFCYHNIYKW